MNSKIETAPRTYNGWRVASFAFGVLSLGAACEETFTTTMSSDERMHAPTWQPPTSERSAAFAASASDRGTAGDPVETAGDELDLSQLRAEVIDVRYEGTLCPAGSVSAVRTAPNGVEVSFEAVLLDAHGSTSSMTGSCKGSVTLELPSGYRVDDGQLCLDRYALTSSASARAELGTVLCCHAAGSESLALASANSAAASRSRVGFATAPGTIRSVPASLRTSASQSVASLVGAP